MAVFILSLKINEIEEIVIPAYINSDKSDKGTNILQNYFIGCETALRHAYSKSFGSEYSLRQ